MLRLYACVTESHDLRLVVLAGVICLLASFTSLSLLRRAVAGENAPARQVWGIAASVAAGCGIWATHFVAMLAFNPYLPVSYDVSTTIVSVLIAVAVTHIGFSIAIEGRGRSGLVALGGAVAGAAISAMHYVGMSALQVPAEIRWDSGWVAASLVVGIGMGSLALAAFLARPVMRTKLGATAILSLGICGMHFSGMTALRLMPDPGIQLMMEGGVQLQWLAIAVACVTVVILCCGLAGAVVDQRLAQRAVQEAERLRRTVAQLEATKSELEATAADLTRALDAASAASQAKSQFLATMSHELRTPLNAVIGFSQMLADEVFGPLGQPRYRDYAQTISESGTHLLNLINDILDFSKSEAGRLELHDDHVDVAGAIAHGVRMMAGQAAAGKVELFHGVDAGLPLVRMDEKRLKQVLLNLLSNAIKFTPAGGEIRVRAYRSGEALAIEVSDTGIGIAAADVPKALERFGQVDGQLARKYEGSGLGLPLSKRLMELHGGTLELTSRPRLGTTVTVTIPAERIVPGRQAA